MVRCHQDIDLGRVALLANDLRIHSWIAVSETLLYTLLNQFFNLLQVHVTLADCKLVFKSIFITYLPEEDFRVVANDLRRELWESRKVFLHALSELFQRLWRVHM